MHPWRSHGVLPVAPLWGFSFERDSGSEHSLGRQGSEHRARAALTLRCGRNSSCGSPGGLRSATVVDAALSQGATGAWSRRVVPRLLCPQGPAASRPNPAGTPEAGPKAVGRGWPGAIRQSRRLPNQPPPGQTAADPTGALGKPAPGTPSGSGQYSPPPPPAAPPPPPAKNAR
jgi:hypothetical protein